jgi:DNA-binding protein HU-beta
VNKPELVNAIASRTGLSKKDCETVLDAFVASVGDALKAGDKVSLVGFGAFEVRKRPARKGRNPKTKEEIMIAASNAPVFKAGRGLKEMVNAVQAAMPPAPKMPAAEPVAETPVP